MDKINQQKKHQLKRQVDSSSSVEVFSFRIILSLFSLPIFLLCLATASALMFTNCGLLEPGECPIPTSKSKTPSTNVTNNVPIITLTTNGWTVGYAATISTIADLPSGHHLAVSGDRLYFVGYSILNRHGVNIYTNLSGTPALENSIGTVFTTLNTGFNNPHGVAVAGDKLYVADRINYRIQIWNGLSTTPAWERTLGTTGSSGSATNQFHNPYAVEVAGDKLYVADTLNHRIQIWNGLSTTPAYERTLGSATPGTSGTGTNQFNVPSDVEVAGDKLYVADSNNHRIQIYDVSGTAPTYERTLGSATPGTGNNEFNYPQGVAVAGDKLYVADKDNHRIQIYDVSGTAPIYERTIGTTGSSGSATNELNQPFGVAVGGDRFYTSDAGNFRIQVYEWTPIVTTNTNFP